MQLFRITLFLWALLTAAAGSTIFGQSPAKNRAADYNGRWILDASQCKGLPPFYSNVKTHALEVLQTDNSLAVTVLIQNTDSGRMKMDLPYKLDGSEVISTTLIRGAQGDMQVPTQLRAEVKTGGDLHFTLSRELQMNGEKHTAATEEDWHLSADGKTLTVRRTDDTPRGKIDTEMVFVKQ